MNCKSTIWRRGDLLKPYEMIPSHAKTHPTAALSLYLAPWLFEKFVKYIYSLFPDPAFKVILQEIGPSASKGKCVRGSKDALRFYCDFKCNNAETGFSRLY